MKLIVLQDVFAVARLNGDVPIPSWAGQGSLSSVTRTPEELSIVCAARGVPGDVRAERDWRCLRIAGTLDFSLTGVMAAIATTLAAADVSIFAVATYDTDYILVREHRLGAAISALQAAGHEVESQSS